MNNKLKSLLTYLKDLDSPLGDCANGTLRLVYNQNLNTDEEIINIMNRAKSWPNTSNEAKLEIDKVIEIYNLICQ